MATPAVPRAKGFSFAGVRDLILPLAIVASVLVILAPLPAALLDVLLASNITIAVIVLLTTIYVRSPLEFSVFPTLLLATTLGRLVLNIATTRLILTRGATEGFMAAGGVVKSFGQFVTGDRLVVGLIIFAIIAIVQFVVITKGATRISEVAARFALDGMPGRQMAIDADFGAGLIDQREAQRRRAEVGQHADFFGAMDGASKFVRGDAIAAIIITLVNIVGGLYLGVIDAGMDLGHAASVYTRLTIGDGLVTQVPALLISIAAALLVTRTSAETSLPAQFLSQLFSRPEPLAVAAGFVGLLAFTSLPTLPLVAVGGGCVGLAIMLTRRQRETQAAEQAKSRAEPKKPPERVEDFLNVDPMEIELGAGLIRLADAKRGGDLLDRVGRVRQTVAAQLGIVMPKVRIRDNLRLDQNQYRVKIADAPVAEGTLYPGMLLAVDETSADGSAVGQLEGMATHDPSTDAPAAWIESELRDQAERLGCRVSEPAGVLAAHLAAIVRSHADELLSLDATKHLVEELKKTSPAVVEELIPGRMKLSEVQHILQLLLREEVPIRQLGAILEALGEYISRTQSSVELVERVRQRLSRVISSQYRDAEGRLFVVTLDPDIEEQIRAGVEQQERGMVVRLSPLVVEAICRAMGNELYKLTAAGHPLIVLVSPEIRSAVKEISTARLPRLVVLSYSEITRDTRMEAVGMVSLEQEAVTSSFGQAA